MGEPSEILARLEPLLLTCEGLDIQIEGLREELLSSLQSLEEKKQSVLGKAFIASLRTNVPTRSCLWGELESEFPEFYQVLLLRKIVRITEPNRPKSLVLKKREVYIL